MLKPQKFSQMKTLIEIILPYRTISFYYCENVQVDKEQILADRELSSEDLGMTKNSTISKTWALKNIKQYAINQCRRSCIIR